MQAYEGYTAHPKKLLGFFSLCVVLYLHCLPRALLSKMQLGYQHSTIGRQKHLLNEL